MASRQVARAAEQDKHATARQHPGVPPSKVALLHRPGDRVAAAARVDEAVAQVVKSRAGVALRELVVRQERVAPPEVATPRSRPEPRGQAEAQAQVDSPERGA